MATLNGNEYAVLYRTYLHQVHAYARRKYPGLDAEDVAQDSMERLWRMRDRLRGGDGGNVRALIFTLADQAAVDQLRKRAREQRAPLYLLSPAAEAGPVADREMIARSLDRLSDTDRQLLHLRWWQGHSLRVIAARMGISDGALRTRMSRATRQCAGAFARLSAAVAALSCVTKLGSLAGRKVTLTTASAAGVTAAVMAAGVGYLAVIDDTEAPAAPAQLVESGMVAAPDEKRLSPVHVPRSQGASQPAGEWGSTGVADAAPAADHWPVVPGGVPAEAHVEADPDPSREGRHRQARDEVKVDTPVGTIGAGGESWSTGPSTACQATQKCDILSTDG